MADDHIDLALRVGTLPDSRLMALRLGTVQRVVCASPAYLAARGTPETPDDLSGHDCIVFEGFPAPDQWRFVRDREIAVSIRPRLAVSTVETAVDAACAGIGLTSALSYHVAAPVAAGLLSTVLDVYRPPEVPVNFVYGAARFLPLKLRSFLDFAAPRLKARLVS